MKLYRKIANLTIGMFALVGSSNVLAENVDHILNLGEFETYSHVTNPGSFNDMGPFKLNAAPNVSVSIVDSEVEGTLNISSFSINSSTGFSGTFADLTSAVFSQGALGTGAYTLTFDGFTDGGIGATYDVPVSAVPLPAAVWLFGSAILGYATFSARRSV
jgi:hypothetical protein